MCCLEGGQYGVSQRGWDDDSIIIDSYAVGRRQLVSVGLLVKLSDWHWHLAPSLGHAVLDQISE